MKICIAPTHTAPKKLQSKKYIIIVITLITVRSKIIPFQLLGTLMLFLLSNNFIIV